MSETTQDSKKANTKNLMGTNVPVSSSLDPAEEYKMNKKRRGLALIFNQESFDHAPVRRGTQFDCDNLKERLNQLSFEVKVYKDEGTKDVTDRIKDAASADHSDADCFLLVFLSHGEDNHVNTKDGKISIQDITALFKGDKCKSLIGKPKIFIIQACRGNQYDNPVTACAVDDDEVVVAAGTMQTLPAGADFIMCYSTAQGYYSMRQPQRGSWYIQDLCETLREHGDTLEFTDLLTLVNRKVSMRSVEGGDASGKKQMPCFASMLTKQVYFRPKK
ncbi:Caspase-6 [Xyrichtys novacula]|uniref:Caspase-6 n=1 Tax=Xyrichtys novacula TaxID=13765 RepID=A0AAV1EUQ2_XYRNO|nr:Caspase-6 [Xyrichtys novacula]